MKIGNPPDLISQAVQELIGQTDPKILPEHTYLCDHCTGYGQTRLPDNTWHRCIWCNGEGRI